jgi:hypothetical protein
VIPRELVKDSRAQASVEYILLLFTAAMLFLALYNVLLKPVVQKLFATIASTFDRALTSSDLHTLPFKR